MQYRDGEGVKIFKPEIKALLEFVNPGDERLRFVNFRVKGGELKVWASDGNNLVIATCDAYDGKGNKSRDEYDWQIHFSALATTMRALESKDVATLRVGKGGIIRDIAINDFESNEQKAMIALPANSVGTTLNLFDVEQISGFSRSEAFSPVGSWSLPASALDAIVSVADANKCPTVRVYAPESQLEPTGVVIGDGAWVVVVAPARDPNCIDDEDEQPRTASVAVSKVIKDMKDTAEKTGTKMSVIYQGKETVLADGRPESEKAKDKTKPKAKSKAKK